MSKKILIIGPASHGYNNDIIKAINILGYNVIYRYDFDETLFSRGIRFISKKLYQKVQQNYFRKLLKSLDIFNDDFEIVLVIRGYSFLLQDIKRLKMRFPSARFVLYQWDPLYISRFDPKALPLFDKAFTFDYKDAEMHSQYFEQKSLFYTYTKNENQSVKYVLSFVGVEHGNRIDILNKMRKILSTNDLPFFFYINSNRMKFIKNLFIYAFNKKISSYLSMKEFIHFKPLQRDEAQRVMWMSDIILDIHHPSQNGLSIRTLEALGKGKKLITTNINIIKEPFYDPSYIYILKPSTFNSKSLLSFFNKITTDIPFKEIGNFTILKWVESLIKNYNNE